MLKATLQEEMAQQASMFLIGEVDFFPFPTAENLGSLPIEVLGFGAPSLRRFKGFRKVRDQDSN